MSAQSPNPYESECLYCMHPLCNLNDFDRQFIGVDKTLGRFGKVTVETCKRCNSKWVHYFVEYPAYRESDRWFRGLVTEEMLNTLTPETAVDILDTLPWHFYGGSYFRTAGGKGVGKVWVDC